MVDREIQALVAYALDTGLIEPCEQAWAVNALLEALELDSYTEPETPAERPVDLPAVLTALMDDAHARGVLKEDSVVYRDLFDTKLMGVLTPRPAQVIGKFRALCAESPEQATDWYYKFSQDTNYIRRDRIAKDVKWIAPTEYGDLDITINLSKPEKDPKAMGSWTSPSTCPSRRRTPRPSPPPGTCPPPPTPGASCAPRTRATPAG